ncbi:hypothetical protein BS47DRAFT_1363255 [Hydnum rufescens UP504]|uniref:Uncharacterized protein n=1 Tax=Hydnum rufescens UP504 TaxID=1448309 RepID=A0A9P6AWS4_9AGAM|nr:hypothetical protein BS47DRAFT_1363255 [Hydnum rufescens UP504]
MDGEGIEHDWSSVNAAAQSTKEMGEGSWHNMLDDIWGDTNYWKILAIGPLLRKKLREAVLQVQTRSEQHETFCKLIPSNSKEEWTIMIQEWEEDKSKPDPYVVETIFKSQVAITLELIAAECDSYSASELDVETSPSAFINMGLDIEDAQCRLCVETSKLKSSSTDTQRANVEHHQLALQRCLATFHGIQKLHMPETISLLLSDTRVDQNTLETIPLYMLNKLHLMPNEIPLNPHPDSGLFHVEAKLRFAQATDALAELH